MAYKIQYTPEEAYRYAQVKDRKPIRLKRWLLVAAILLGIAWVRYNGIPDFLIPGDKEVTVSATKNMVDNLQNGISFNDAVTAFCREILHGAGY